MLCGPQAQALFHCVIQATNGNASHDFNAITDSSYNHQVDHHTVAAISVSGICLDVLGGLYLAYDLLGGQHGPLRLLTRMVTYSIVFGVGYGLGLGLWYGMAAGLTTGITVAIELHRTSRKPGGHYALRWEAFFSAIRGLGFAIGLYPMAGMLFGLAFGALITAGQTLAYTRGIRPSMDYAAARRPRLTRRQFRAAVVRTIGYIAAFMVCSKFVRHVDNPWTFAFKAGVVTGVVTAIGTIVNPYIEYYADNLAQRRLGVLGIMIVFCGFVLQSVQYLVALFDVPVT